MNRLSLGFLPVLLLVLSGCTTSPKPTVSTKQPAITESAPVEVPAAPAADTAAADTYALQHRVFPNLLFKTEGKFFASLHSGEFERLRDIIAENYGEAYSKAMRMKAVSLPDIVFVTFPEPARVPLCYHAAFVKKGDTFLYLTLEKAEDLLSTGVKSALCGWTADGSHVNYGPRYYTAVNEFEDDVRSLLARLDEPKPGAVTTSR